MTDVAAGPSLDEIDFPSAETMKCPFALYSRFREDAPVYKLPGRNEYVISRYDDIFAVTMDPESFSNHSSIFENGYMRSGTLEDHANPDIAWGIGNSDAPQHTWKRKLAFEMFKPGVLRQYEGMLREHVDTLIDGFIADGEVEFVSQFAARLPAMVILSIFGLPLEHVDRAIRWSAFDGMGTRYNSPEVQEKAREALVDLGEYLRELVVERAANPGSDALSAHLLKHAEIRGHLDVPHIVAEAAMLLAGGIITTNHLIASMMKLLLDNPDEMARVREDNALLRRAVEETLRVESPVQFGLRLALKDSEIGGTTIPAGAICMLLWGSANRDPERFEAADEFRIDRKNAKANMAFGNGPHFCLGAPLARLEAQIAFEQILKRLGDISYIPGRNDFSLQPTVTFRAPKQLFLAFSKA